LRRHTEVDRPCIAAAEQEHSRGAGRAATRLSARPPRGCDNRPEEEAVLIDDTPSWTAVALDDAECRRLLATPDFGRLVFTSEALPVVRPVRFCVRDGEVLIPAHPGGRLARAVRGAVVAFEVDSLDALTGAGWTVTAVGPAHVLTDLDDIAAAELLGLRTWIPTARYSYVAVQIGLLRGYRVSPVTDRSSTSPVVDHLPQF
jgi:hypothetical protein